MVSVPGSERQKVLPALDALRIKYPNQTLSVTSKGIILTG